MAMATANKENNIYNKLSHPTAALKSHTICFSSYDRALVNATANTDSRLVAIGEEEYLPSSSSECCSFCKQRSVNSISSHLESFSAPATKARSRCKSVDDKQRSAMSRRTRSSLFAVFSTLTDFKNNIQTFASNKKKIELTVAEEPDMKESLSKKVAAAAGAAVLRSKSAENLLAHEKQFVSFKSSENCVFASENVQIKADVAEASPKAQPRVQPRTIYLNYDENVGQTGNSIFNKSCETSSTTDSEDFEAVVVNEKRNKKQRIVEGLVHDEDENSRMLMLLRDIYVTSTRSNRNNNDKVYVSCFTNNLKSLFLKIFQVCHFHPRLRPPDQS